MSDKLHRRTEWMAMCKGLPAHTVAKILRKHTGVDWSKCSKGNMAEAWIDGAVPDRDALRKELEAAPRVSPAERKQKKAQRNIAQRLEHLRTAMWVALETTEGTDWLAQKLVDTGASPTEIQMLLTSWKEDVRKLEKEIERTRRQITYVVQLEMAAQRALRMKQ